MTSEGETNCKHCGKDGGHPAMDGCCSTRCKESLAYEVEIADLRCENGIYKAKLADLAPFAEGMDLRWGVFDTEHKKFRPGMYDKKHMANQACTLPPQMDNSHVGRLVPVPILVPGKGKVREAWLSSCEGVMCGKPWLDEKDCSGEECRCGRPITSKRVHVIDQEEGE